MALLGTDLSTAKRFLATGDVVGIPTETVYGLAGNALNVTAVLRIFEVKNRPSFDPLIVHIDSAKKLTRYATEVPPAARTLAERFWPGPLTLLLPKRPIIPDLVTSGLDTVALRVPRHPLTLELLRTLDFPLAAPSANPFGYISPTTARHVADQLGARIPYVLDGGPCGVGVESTIVSFPGATPTVLRLGGVPLEAIEDAIGPVAVQTHSSSNPAAPGMLLSHYAPRKPLVLYPSGGTPGTVGPDEGVLPFNEKRPEVPPERQRVLAPGGEATEAARNLFAYLRELDARPDLTRLHAELLPETGLGRAVNDRLRRAAAKP
jgi:L-threonylcarbamoyladenylate synthase